MVASDAMQLDPARGGDIAPPSINQGGLQNNG
jgi:hypothetical protein